MKIALVLAASLISGAAFAQSTTIIEKREVPSTTVIEKHEAPAVLEKRSVEVTGSVGCSTTTKQKTDVFGETTTKQKTEC